MIAGGPACEFEAGRIVRGHRTRTTSPTFLRSDVGDSPLPGWAVGVSRDPEDATMGDGDEDEDEDETVRLVVCPACEGTGRMGPADGRPCVMCAGRGMFTAEVAKEITRSDEMGVEPPGDG